MKRLVPLLFTVFYILIILVNTLSNTLPLNNKTTGELSDNYNSLITPAGFAFSIWSLIYLLLLIFIIKVWKEYKNNEIYFRSLLSLFILQSVFNISWLFAWHYEKIGLSALIMLGLLTTLIFIYRYVSSNHLWRAPWSLYLGWISVAFIVNISVLILHEQIDFFINHNVEFSFLMAGIAFILGLLISYFQQDAIYPLVISWALFFIGMAHKDLNNYALVVWSGALLLVIWTGYISMRKIN